MAGSRRGADEDARRLAGEALAAGRPTGWFEPLYAAAVDGSAVVPWDREGPSRLLVDWAEGRRLHGRGRSALVVGCGLGRDAEYIARLGFRTVAFDISPTAVRTARERHPESPVLYCTADLLDPPAGWLGGFDLVVESMNVQSLPEPPRSRAITQVAAMVRPGGTLLVVAAARSEADPVDPPPWPLTGAEIDAFAGETMQPVRIEDLRDPLDPSVRRWRAEFRRERSAR